MFIESSRVVPDAPGWKNYELRFRFQFPGKSEKHFDVELPVKPGGRFGKDKTFSIHYADNYRVSAPGGKGMPIVPGL